MSSIFPSFMMAGFECSTHISPRLGRHDLVGATRHDHQALEDYRRLEPFGIRTVREGLRWHLIETTAGRYDFSSVHPVVTAARATGAQVVWDLFHYGWPDDLDIFGDAFVDRFASFASAFAQFVTRELPGPLIICPVNEISFFSWAAGTAALFHPFERERGHDLKLQLVRASLAACRAVWSVSPEARIIHPDPVIHVHPHPSRPELDEAAAGYTRAQWDGWNMLAGGMEPTLGGDPRYLDILGLNFYPSNQWELRGDRVHPDDERWKPFSEIALEAYRRFGRPIVVTETGAEGAMRAPWLRTMVAEVERARALGVPILGVCLYPILDHPGWDDDRNVQCGLWGYRRRGERRLDEALAIEVTATARVWHDQLTAGEPHPRPHEARRSPSQQFSGG